MSPNDAVFKLTNMSLGGFFRARLSFPTEYPLMPPKMRFETPIFHPNSTTPETPDIFI
jgi:ubiquitin-protein ligase